MIYEGDNLAKMGELPDTCIDMTYIDPPFNSDRIYEAFWEDESATRQFVDKGKSTQEYIDYMRPRCQQIKRVLRSTGMFFYHCDWHAVHYVKVMLDEIFGEQNFVNEIIWKRQSSHNDAKQGSRHLGRVHDSILVYSGGDKKYYFKHVYGPYRETYVSKFYRHEDEATGRRFRLGDLTGPGGASKGNPKYELLGVTRYWRYSKKRMKELLEEGRIHQTKAGRVPQYKRYLDEGKGVPVGSVWDNIAPVHGSSRERIGYPTQKPLALLQRIIEIGCPEGGVVLDSFCGCGTTLIAAAMMKRRWVGIDVSPTACRVMADRLHRDLQLMEGVDFHVRTMQTDMDRLENMDPYDFQNWAVNALGGIPNPLKGADKGIDGRLRLVNTKVPETVQKTFIFAREAGSQLDLFDDYVIPIQVKQTKKVGRPDVDAFQTAMRRAEAKMGIMVGFDFTKQAREEIRRARKKENLVIQPITVIEILDQQAA